MSSCAAEQPTSLLIETPIRSGQSVIFPNGDVTVLGSVASGSEIVAGGSIHVYGTLRGRAMAGTANSNNRAPAKTKRMAYFQQKPVLQATGDGTVSGTHHTIGSLVLDVDDGAELLFCDNESNGRRLWNVDGPA